MDNSNDNFFNSSVGVRFSPDEVVSQIIGFMRAEPLCDYRITIGTDSLKAEAATADFVTAIVVHRVGHGGRYFWRRLFMDKLYTLRDRITQEVLVSLDVAKDFLSQLQRAEAIGEMVPHYGFEIHVDIGENGATKVMIQELVGMIRANNFEAKTKPYSYAASNVADKHV